MTTPKNNVLIVPYAPEHEDFVFHSWKRSQKVLALKLLSETKTSREKYYQEQHERILEYMNIGVSKVMVAAKDPGIYLGFVCAQPKENIVHWCSVKVDFRRDGFAKDLLTDVGIDLAKPIKTTVIGVIPSWLKAKYKVETL